MPSESDCAGTAVHDDLQPGLRRMFADGLPAPGWPRDLHGHAVVVLLDVREWMPWLAQAKALLDADELARVRRRRIDSDRNMLILAYAFHRLLLAAATARATWDVPLHRDALGCPRLRDGSLQTSLSHADGFVAIAMTTNGAIGVDIEPVARAGALPGLSASVCHPREMETLAGPGDTVDGPALLSLWVRKEALLKEAGVGLAQEMTTFIADEGVVQCATGGHEVELCMLDAGPSCVAAVAKAPGIGVSCHWMRPAPARGTPDARAMS